MANKLLNFLAIFFIAHFFIFPLGYFVHGVSAKITSCSQTPYPEVCNHFMGDSFNNLEANLDQSPFSFRDQAIQVTLNQAVRAHNLVSTMDLSSFDERAKLAWNDCLELYENTVNHLAKSKSTTNPMDAQTWLSAAIANQQTCQNGFTDFNLASHLQTFPSMLGNFTKLLSNSLAINKDTVTSSSVTKQVGNRRLLGFPSWVSAADRKLLQKSGAPAADIVVAQDGSGNYKTISEAVAAASGGKRTVIHVKAGVYRESLDIKKSNIMLIGDGIDATVITGSKSAQTTTTFRSATVGLMGDRFIARDITFENTAGPQKHQAVALRSGSDFSVFYRCSFKAQGRQDPNENTGIIIHNSRVTAASGASGFKSYLGRPWQKYSRTVFMKSAIDGMIAPEGWLAWSGNFALSTLYYAEHMNSGAGAATGGRVKWPGYRVISAAEAGKFTVGNFLAGGAWIPGTGVPFDAGL
ncbi:Pectinesterase, catalytic [Corchorus olitorius]|uniref:Pectinesterase n=1 Tax=Corchorus olitorius TaxID=93759 RepID=A0A1R3JYG7_9ROSI|nr:Pectinesterase, catalytic [Corchorus olitorius]